MLVFITVLMILSMIYQDRVYYPNLGFLVVVYFILMLVAAILARLMWSEQKKKMKGTMVWDIEVQRKRHD